MCQTACWAHQRKLRFRPYTCYRHGKALNVKRGIQDFHMNYVLVPADKAPNNVVVV